MVQCEHCQRPVFVVIGNKGLFKQLPHSLALVKDLQNQSNDNNKAKVPSTYLPVQFRFHFSKQRVGVCMPRVDYVPFATNCSSLPFSKYSSGYGELLDNIHHGMLVHCYCLHLQWLQLLLRAQVTMAQCTRH